MDCHNQPDFTDQNTIVYGHNMKNGSMFGTLDKYQDKELFEQHPEFYLYLPDKILKDYASEKYRICVALSQRVFSALEKQLHYLHRFVPCKRPVPDRNCLEKHNLPEIH